MIKTISGNVFAKDATDWTWWDPSVPAALKNLYMDKYVSSETQSIVQGNRANFDFELTISFSYNIAILTNQGSISLKNDPKTIKSDQRSLSAFKTKVSNILKHFDFPVTLLAATARDQYRKPRTGMWSELLEELDLEVGDGLDLSASFFVGDAGGRPARKNHKADHSCSDRNLATNLGIEFKTPEEYFLHEEPEPYIRQFEPNDYFKAVSDNLPNASKLLNSTDHAWHRVKAY